MRNTVLKLNTSYIANVNFLSSKKERVDNNLKMSTRNEFKIGSILSTGTLIYAGISLFSKSKKHVMDQRISAISKFILLAPLVYSGITLKNSLSLLSKNKKELSDSDIKSNLTAMNGGLIGNVLMLAASKILHKSTQLKDNWTKISMMAISLISMTIGELFIIGSLENYLKCKYNK